MGIKKIEIVRATCDWPNCLRTREFKLEEGWQFIDLMNAMAADLWKFGGTAFNEDYCLFHNSDTKEYVG